MRISRLFIKTLRESPSEAEIASHQLLLRAGCIRTLASGSYSLLPLGLRVAHKIEAIFREEMDAIGGQEILMPVVHPAELWQETGRWQAVGPEMLRFKDRNGRDMVLAMTHEEVVTDIARRQVKSYRDLPVLVYQIQTKYRDEPRPRAGLIRTREFTMKDLYSFHADVDGLDAFYREVYQAYHNIFGRAGIDALAVLSDTGMMGGTMAHEFMFLAEVGEDTLITCPHCHYAANRQIAVFAKTPSPTSEPAPMEDVATPSTTSIAQVSKLLGTPPSGLLKSTFFVADHELVVGVIRGDMEVNETKLANVLGARDLRPASAEEARAAGLVPGYASPVGISQRVIADDAVVAAGNLTGGANRHGFHTRNIRYGRDFTAAFVADIAAAQAGDACVTCGQALTVARGVEVGNIFKLGTRYSAAMGATFLDQHGETRQTIMGSYGIGTGRLMACVVEQWHDAKGIIWPATIAPFDVHLLHLGTDGTALAAAQSLHDALDAAGLDVLFDDRAEGAGVKFNDADLIGLPVRVTVSPRTLAQGEAEIKRRSSAESIRVPLTDVVTAVNEHIRELRAEVLSAVKPVRLP